MKEKYRNTTDKDEKTELSRSIVDQVFAYGGKFVKKDAGSARYCVLTKAEARIKTSQALRENRDAKSGASGESEFDCDSSCQAPPSTRAEAVEDAKAKSVGLDTDSLDCCQALVTLSRATSPPLVSSKAA